MAHLHRDDRILYSMLDTRRELQRVAILSQDPDVGLQVLLFLSDIESQ